jgi:hypothetical protein
MSRFIEPKVIAESYFPTHGNGDQFTHFNLK